MTRIRNLLGRCFLAVTVGAAAWSAAGPAAGEGRPVALAVDATDAPRNLLHVREGLPVGAGPVTLYYAKWIPGEHGPTGPVVDLVGLQVAAAGRRLAWRRDATDMHAIRLDVPRGVTDLEIAFDVILPPTADGFTSGASATAGLLVLNWNQVILYPLPVAADQYRVSSRLTLPAGWRFASALDSVGQDSAGVRFATVSLQRLIDSPVLAAAAFRRLALTDPGVRPPVYLTVGGDTEEALAVPDSYLAACRKLVGEATALFGATHYDRYEFLLTLSDHVAHFGLEHHQSSDDRQGAKTFTDSDHRRLGATLLPHEYAHSWNGKYRRPVGLATGDYAMPYNDELLWVYEGLTNYLGAVLAVRSGLQTVEDFRSDLALTAAGLAARPGRTWRPLQDAADEAQLLYSARSDYDAWRRSAADIYDEGTLLWLEVDVTLRQLTGGRRSLDDFCRDFAGPPGGPPAERLYTFDDIVRTLEHLAPHDWRGLLNERLQAVTAAAPLGGLTGSGWRLAYREAPTDLQRAASSVYEMTDARFSLGLLLSESDGRAGAIVDVIPQTPAARAGLAPGMTLVAVNGRRYAPEVLAAALDRGAQAKSPLDLLVERQDLFSTYRIDYQDGQRFPALDRNQDAADLLSLIAAPLTGDRRQAAAPASDWACLWRGCCPRAACRGARPAWGRDEELRSGGPHRPPVRWPCQLPAVRHPGKHADRAPRALERCRGHGPRGARRGRRGSGSPQCAASCRWARTWLPILWHPRPTPWVLNCVTCPWHNRGTRVVHPGTLGSSPETDSADLWAE